MPRCTASFLVLSASMGDDEADEERTIEALSAVYGAERQDLPGLMGHALTLLGVIVAYSGIATGILGDDPARFSQALFPVILAFPVWMVIAFHVTLMANVFAHGKSTMILERALLDAAGMKKRV